MASVVIELQKELSNSNVKLSATLNKAYLIAKKLNIQELEKFLDKEMRGYSNEDELPEYRKFNGTVKYYNPYHGWFPLSFRSTKQQDNCSTIRLYQPISELEAIIDNAQGSELHIQMSPEFCNALEHSPQASNFFPVSKITAILERIKLALLDWTLQLEESNILGENLLFTTQEKETAQEKESIKGITINMGNDGKVNVMSTDSSTTYKG